MILNTSAENGSVSSGIADHDLFFVVDVDALNRRNIERRRQIVHHRVQQILHALVLERRPAHHRENLLRDGRLADARAQLVFGDRLTPSTNFVNR